MSNTYKTSNLRNFLSDIADALREKHGGSDLINAQNFSELIKSGNNNTPGGGGGSSWTGHADAAGLRAIGWTDEDIAYYQEHGIVFGEIFFYS